MRTAQILIGVLCILAPLGTASGQAPSASPSAPPPIQSTVGNSPDEAALPYVPPVAHGYKLTDTVRFSEPGSGIQYVYKQSGAVANVFVSPYGNPPPATQEDTLALVQKEVERVRQPLQDASLQRELQNFVEITDRADVVHAARHGIPFYWYFAGVRRRGEPAVFLYYAVYAIPYGLVRIRAELPWESANNFSTVGRSTAYEPLSAFGNSLVTAMVTPTTPAVTATPTVVASAAPAAGPALPGICSTIPPATDTINYRVYATLDAPGRKDSLPAGYVEMVLDALRHSLVVPNPLGLTVYAAMVSGQGGIMVPAVYGEVVFTLDDQGKASDIHLTQSSLSPALDQSFFDAPRRADSLQAFPGQIGVTNPGKIRFYVSFSPFDSHKGRSMPFFTVRLPAWRPGARPAIDPTRDLKPTFPIDARNAPGGDSVSIQFVVDDHGAPVKSTMRLLSANYVEYAQVVVDAALHSQYIPAMAAGCPVPGLLERTWRMTVGAQ